MFLRASLGARCARCTVQTAHAAARHIHASARPHAAALTSAVRRRHLYSTTVVPARGMVTVACSARMRGMTVGGMGGLQRRTMFIQTQDTPNPDSVKFVPGVDVLGPDHKSTIIVKTPVEARVSPLARQLVLVEGVEGVMLASDFVTVTKQADVEWDAVKPAVFATLMDFFASGQPVVNDEALAQHKAKTAKGTAGDKDDIETMIEEVIDEGIRPYLQEDGGDIEFVSFVDGIVNVRLQGACQSCPSSTYTVKNNVEGMLQHYLHPHVKGVVELKDDDGEMKLSFSPQNPYQHIEDAIKPKPRAK